MFGAKVGVRLCLFYSVNVAKLHVASLPADREIAKRSMKVLAIPIFAAPGAAADPCKADWLPVLIDNDAAHYGTQI